VSDHERFEKLCALAVTGDLEPEEFRLLGEHLYECARCRTSYQDFHAIIERGLPTLQISCRPGWSLRGLGMKKRFLERARKEGIPIAPSSLRNQFGLRLLVAAVVTCLVLLVGYGWHVLKQDRDRYLEAAGHVAALSKRVSELEQKIAAQTIPSEDHAAVKPDQTGNATGKLLNLEAELTGMGKQYENAEPSPAVQPKRAEPVRDRQTAAAKPVTATGPVAAVTPAPATPPPPVPTPVPAANSQQTASNSNASPPGTIALPAPETPIAPPEPPSPAPAEPTTKHVTIPAGTEVYVLTIDSIDSETSHPNQTFKASLDKPIVVDNQTIIPRRSDVLLKVTEVEQARKLKGTSQLKVQLDRLFIGKDSYQVASNTFEEKGSSEAKKAARNVGIGAAVGGILGGLFGGKNGPLIGVGAGGGGGAVVTKPDQLRIHSETQLMFKLENPLDVTINMPPASAARNNGSYGPAAPPFAGDINSSLLPVDIGQTKAGNITRPKSHERK
jgi:hypothetical protein